MSMSFERDPQSLPSRRFEGPTINQRDAITAKFREMTGHTEFDALREVADTVKFGTFTVPDGGVLIREDDSFEALAFGTAVLEWSDGLFKGVRFKCHLRGRFIGDRIEVESFRVTKMPDGTVLFLP